MMMYKLLPVAKYKNTFESFIILTLRALKFFKKFLMWQEEIEEMVIEKWLTLFYPASATT
jgi:hypothetical protein